MASDVRHVRVAGWSGAAAGPVRASRGGRPAPRPGTGCAPSRSMTWRTRRSTVRWENPVCRAIAASVTPAATGKDPRSRRSSPAVRARPGRCAQAATRSGPARWEPTLSTRVGWRTSRDPPPSGGVPRHVHDGRRLVHHEHQVRQLLHEPGSSRRPRRGPAARPRRPRSPAPPSSYVLGITSPACPPPRRRCSRWALGRTRRTASRSARERSRIARMEVGAPLTLSAPAEGRSSEEVEDGVSLPRRWACGSRPAPGRTPG